MLKAQHFRNIFSVVCFSFACSEESPSCLRRECRCLKMASARAHTLLWASLKENAPPTIFSARHFFRKLSETYLTSKVIPGCCSPMTWEIADRFTIFQHSIHTTLQVRDGTGCFPPQATTSPEAAEPHLSSYSERCRSQKNKYGHTHSSVLPTDVPGILASFIGSTD